MIFVIHICVDHLCWARCHLDEHELIEVEGAALVLVKHVKERLRENIVLPIEYSDANSDTNGDANRIL